MPIPRFIKPSLKKWYYSYWPGQAGSFPYFGARVYFPRRSHLFRRVCIEDVYESFHVRLIAAFFKPDSVYFDVGANIGLMSVPLLSLSPNGTVVSFEPSPSALEYLMRTHDACSQASRWRIIPKAVGREFGAVDFHCRAPEYSAFDSLKDTQRGGSQSIKIVPVTTLDEEWKSLGCPSVSVIKIDVEGAELGVLQGGGGCIQAGRPAILIEWNLRNLAAFGCAPEDLLDWTAANDYALHALPHGVIISSRGLLQTQMLQTENFLLLPPESRPPPVS